MASQAPPMIDYSQFNPENVINLSPNEKTWSKIVEGKEEKGTFKEVPLLYRYNVGNVQKTDKTYVQYPEVTIPNGIKEDSRGGYPSYSVMMVFGQDNVEHVKLINNVLNPLYHRIANLIGPIKGQLGKTMTHFNPQSPEALLGELIYTQRDKISGEIVEGKDPTQFYRMYKNTIFSDLNGRPIDHNILKAASIKGIPCICFSHVYVGTKMSIKSHLQSFIVTGVKKSDGLARQLGTIQKIRESNSSAVTDLEAQIAALMGDTQDSLYPTMSENSGNRQEHHQEPHDMESDIVQASMIPKVPQPSTPSQLPNPTQQYQVPTQQLPNPTQQLPNPTPQLPNPTPQLPPQLPTPTQQYQVPTPQFPTPTQQYQAPPSSVSPDMQAFLAQAQTTQQPQQSQPNITLS